MKRADDGGAATVVGAILVFAILGISLVYVNAYHVPRQGAALEIAAGERAEDGLVSLASRLDAREVFTHDLPLQAPPSTPPLLSALVLSPVRAPGAALLEPDAWRVGVSVLVAAPPSGVPAGDPVRESAPGGLMRVHLVGNSTTPHSAGALAVTTGGAYLEPATAQLEGGGVFAKRNGTSVPLAPPALVVGRAGSLAAPTTSLEWNLPLLAGRAGGVGGLGGAQATLSPGLPARVGGDALVHEVEIRIETRSLAAWSAALESAVGAHGSVAATPGAQPDAGTIVARILPPPGAPAGAPRVQLDLTLVRHVVTLAERAG